MIVTPNPPRDYADLREALRLAGWIARRQISARLRPRTAINALGQRVTQNVALASRDDARRFMDYQQARVENRWLRVPLRIATLARDLAMLVTAPLWIGPFVAYAAFYAWRGKRRHRRHAIPQRDCEWCYPTSWFHAGVPVKKTDGSELVG